MSGIWAGIDRQRWVGQRFGVGWRQWILQVLMVLFVFGLMGAHWYVTERG
ncbi:hypothetical protein [Streptomyces sp. NBC_01565]|nr:hypothetical protein [Streptomyces sp. NBC_01565]MCX4546874.1 hypothetical protein [Streptomyces sp. NBC_01565]